MSGPGEYRGGRSAVAGRRAQTAETGALLHVLGARETRLTAAHCARYMSVSLRSMDTGGFKH